MTPEVLLLASTSTTVVLYMHYPLVVVLLFIYSSTAVAGVPRTAVLFMGSWKEYGRILAQSGTAVPTKVQAVRESSVESVVRVVSIRSISIWVSGCLSHGVPGPAGSCGEATALLRFSAVHDHGRHDDSGGG